MAGLEEASDTTWKAPFSSPAFSIPHARLVYLITGNLFLTGWVTSRKALNLSKSAPRSAALL